MVDRLDGSELASKLANGPFPYEAYGEWLDETPASPALHMLATEAMELRPRASWNSLGREVYDRGRLTWHAKKVVTALSECAPDATHRAIVKHSGRPFSWIPNRGIPDNVRDDLQQFLTAHVPVDEPEYNGAFLVERELDSWLSELCDYAYLLKYRDVEFVSLDAPVLLCANHHLTIQIYAPDAQLLDQMQRLLESDGIRTARANSD